MTFLYDSLPIKTIISEVIEICYLMCLCLA